MSPKRTYYGFTTPQQRKLLFEIWEKTGNIEEACRAARVSQRFFYYWKPRFEKGGYAGLEEFQSRVAHKLNRKSPEIEAKVLELHQQHSDWGKARIANEMAKGNNWMRIISPNTVKRILQAAGEWHDPGAGKKRSRPKRSPNG